MTITEYRTITHAPTYEIGADTTVQSKARIIAGKNGSQRKWQAKVLTPDPAGRVCLSLPTGKRKFPVITLHRQHFPELYARKPIYPREPYWCALPKIEPADRPTRRGRKKRNRDATLRGGFSTENRDDGVLPRVTLGPERLRGLELLMSERPYGRGWADDENSPKCSGGDGYRCGYVWPGTPCLLMIARPTTQPT